MNDTGNLQELFELDETGVCVTSPKGEVLFQNETCKSVCGDHQRQQCHLCEDIPLEELSPNIFPFFSKSSILSRVKTFLAGTLCSLVKFRDKGKTITLFNLEKATSEDYVAFFKAQKLTSREIEVALLLTQGKTNQDILVALTITKPTLKTHLNHIYKKCPAMKKLRGS